MSRIIALLALCVLSLFSTACDKVPLLAPTDSTISLTVNTTTLPLNGTAQVTAIVLEASGTAPQNGTVVTFTTTLGSVNPVEARTTNGFATTTFHAGTRVGLAEIRGFSGGAVGGETDSLVEVAIGAGETGTIGLRVESTSGAGTIHQIVATVLDEAGNRVPNAPVTFTTTAGQVSPGFAISDGNGEARTTLTTSAAATVTARSGAAEGTVDIAVPGTLTLVAGEGQTPPFEVGVPVNFTVTPAGESFFSNVVVDFGDGTPQMNLGAVAAARNFTHTFTQRGNFTVTATGTTATGTSPPSSVAVQVNDRAPVGFTVSPATVSLAAGGVATLTVSGLTPSTSVISRVNWAYGDGRSDQTTGPGTTHRYTAVGTYTVGITVTTTDGRQGSGSTTVVVNP